MIPCLDPVAQTGGSKMKTYAIDFKSVNVKKETITCISFIQSETLFLAIHTFEEKTAVVVTLRLFVK
jgi:hypothetical protein